MPPAGKHAMSRIRNAEAQASHCGLVPRQSKSGKSDDQGMPLTKSAHRVLKKYSKDLMFSPFGDRFRVWLCSAPTLFG
jgi:hypothetical protein